GARKGIGAASGMPAAAYAYAVTGTRADGTPSERPGSSDAPRRPPPHSYDASDTRSGTRQYRGTVPLGTTATGSGYTLTDGGRGGHTTDDLNGGTTGTGTLFTDADD
ncbi:peptidase M4 family protein, partial [Streptomyces sp. BE133]|nr:peptidase M4 family protein [Streptomyces sp. BE133]